MNTIITNDRELAMAVAFALKGEKYLEEHNGHIDLDDDDALAAMFIKGIF